MEEQEKATRDLISWGILERNNVNEVFPTADFLCMLYEQKGHEIGWEEWAASEEEDAEEDL